MADKGAVGGRKAAIYLVKIDHTAIVKADGTTTATAYTDKLIEVSTGLLKPSFKSDKITLELVKHDQELVSFIKNYKAPASTSDAAGEKLTALDGTSWSTETSGSGVDALLVIWTGSTEADGINTLAALCSLDADAINFEAEFKKHSKRILNFTPISPKVAITIANGLLPTGLYGVAATLTIPVGEPIEQQFLPAA